MTSHVLITTLFVVAVRITPRLFFCCASHLTFTQVAMEPTLVSHPIPRSRHFTYRSPEGPWSEVMQAIHDCHAAVHAKGAPRIATDIRIGTRVDREIAPGTGNAGKVKRVEDILAQNKSA